MNDVNIKIEEWNEPNLKKLLFLLKNSQGVKLTLSYEGESQYSRNTEARLTGILAGIGIPSHLKGYSYIKTAVELCLKDRSELECVTKRLYPEIAKRYSVDSNRVEHAIRHAIQTGWKQDNKRMKEVLFGYSVGKDKKPTNAAFIATITDHLQLDSEKRIPS